MKDLEQFICEMRDMSLCFVISRHSFEQLSGIIFSRHQQRFNFIHFSTIFFKVKFNGALGMSLSYMFGHGNMWAWGGWDGIFSEDLTCSNNGSLYNVSINCENSLFEEFWKVFLKIIQNPVDFGWFFKDVVEYFPNWEQWECVRWEWEVGWCTFWGLHWPSNDKSTFLSRIQCPIQNPALPFSMLGIEYGRKGKVFKTRLQQRALTECWKRCLEHQYSTCYNFNKIRCRWRSRVQ